MESKSITFDIEENENGKLLINLPITICGNENQIILAALDTGYNGFIAAPPEIANKAKALHSREVKCFQAYGEEIIVKENLILVYFEGKCIAGHLAIFSNLNGCLAGLEFLQQLGMDVTISCKNKKITFSKTTKEAKKEKNK
ncbi:MAG: hypothetical protein ACOZAR_01575 [Patescibacteria group bacterium]